MAHSVVMALAVVKGKFPAQHVVIINELVRRFDLVGLHHGSFTTDENLQVEMPHKLTHNYQVCCSNISVSILCHSYI